MKISYELELMSKLLNSEDIGYEHIVFKKIEELKKYIYEGYASLINEGGFPEKAKSIEDLDRIMNYIETVIKYSMFIGKTVIGVMIDSDDKREKFLANEIGISEKDYNLHLNKSIPIIYNSAKGEMLFVNNFDYIDYINSDDVKIIFNDLMYKRKIDLRKNISSIVNNQEFKHENIVYILFPKYADKYAASYKKLINITNLIIIDKDEKLDLSLKYLSKIKYDKEIYITENNSTYRYNKLKLLNINQFRINDVNIKRYNIDFISMIDNIVLKSLQYYKNSNKKTTKTLAIIKKSILNSENDSDELKRIKKDAEKNISFNENIIEEMVKFRTELYRIVEEITNIVKEINDIDDNIYLDPQREELLFDRISKLIDVEEYDEAKELMKKLNCQEAKFNILNLEINRVKKLPLEKESLKALANSSSNNEQIIKAKIKFSEELIIPDSELMKLALRVKKCDTGKEYYYKGKYHQSINEIDKSLKLFKMASAQEELMSMDELYNIYLKQENNIRNMEYLATLLHKDANYYLAKHYRDTKNTYYLKMSAALGKIEAIYDLANYYLYIDKNYDAAIQLFEILEQVNYKNEDVMLKLGKLYYYTKKYQNAVELLEKCKNEESYLLLGKIYEYGLGRMKNEEVAKDYYLYASKLGNGEAKAKVLKLEARLNENERIKKTKQSNYSSSSYSDTSSYSSSSSSSSSSSYCFITTAVCKSLGKEDNCKEILLFKSFRDNWLIYQDDGEEIISKYYKIAPGIVDRINNKKEAELIYNMLWKKYISICYDSLMNKEYTKAKKIYISMVKYLEENI